MARATVVGGYAIIKKAVRGTFENARWRYRIIGQRDVRANRRISLDVVGLYPRLGGRYRAVVSGFSMAMTKSA